MSNRYKIKTWLTLTLIISGLVACVDEKPEDDTPTPIEIDASRFIPIYDKLIDFLDYGGWWFCQEITSDEMTCPTRDTDWDDGGKWRALHQHEWTNSSEAIQAMWPRFFSGIYEIHNLRQEWVSGQGQEQVDVALAKLTVLRGLFYYYLLDNYGDVPFISNDSALPQFPFKSPRDSVWQAVVNEVAPIIWRLENNTSAKYMATKGMAYMLMAKLYLNAEIYTGTPQWEIAEKYCDSVLSLGYSLESNPLAPFVTENQNSTEIIFAIPYDEDMNQGFNLHLRTLHYQNQLTYNMEVSPWNGFATLEQHYNSYEDNDLRKSGYFLAGEQKSYTGETLHDPGANNAILVLNPHIPALNMGSEFSRTEIRMSGARVSKFEIKLGAKQSLSNDFPLFRLADAMLMKAEALLRQGKASEALQYVEPIRSRANATPFVMLDEDLLLAERGREMFYEGHRRQDLIRFGKFNSPWWEKTSTDPTRKIFPVPANVIANNPNLGK